MVGLTVGQRIILHVSRYTGLFSDFEVPVDITQEGIAEHCEISRSHAAVEIKRLREKGLLTEELRHVKGGRSRRKVYFLTEDGIREKIAILRFAEENGLDISNPGTKKTAEKKEAGRKFVGREKELAALGDWFFNEKNPVIMNLHGLPGVGKTALLRHFGDENGIMTFIHETMSFDSLRAVLLHLADFLSERKLKRLKRSLERGYDTGELIYILSSDLQSPLLIVIDGNIRDDLFRDMLGLISVLPDGIKLLISTVRPLTDLILAPLPEGFEMETIALSPLTRGEVIDLLEGMSDYVDVDIDSIMENTGGFPLLLGAMMRDWNDFSDGTKKSGSDVMVSEFMGRIVSNLPQESRDWLVSLAVARAGIPHPRTEIKISNSAFPFIRSGPDGIRLHPLMRESLLYSASSEEMRKAHLSAAEQVLSPVEEIYHYLSAGHPELASPVIEKNIRDLSHNYIFLAGRTIASMIHLNTVIPPQLNYILGEYYSLVGDWDAATFHYGKILETGGDSRELSFIMARAMIGLGRIASKRNEFQAAIDYFVKAIRVSRRYLHMREEAIAEKGIAAVRIKQGDLTEAERHADKAVELASMARDDFILSLVHVDKGNINFRLGNYKQALNEYESALELAGEHAVPAILYNLAICHYNLGDTSRAETMFRESIDKAVSIGAVREEAYSRAAHTDFVVEIGGQSEVEKSREEIDIAVKIFEKIGDSNGLAISLANRAKLRTRLRDIDNARMDAREALRLAGTIGTLAIAESIEEEISKLGLF